MAAELEAKARGETAVTEKVYDGEIQGRARRWNVTFINFTLLHLMYIVRMLVKAH